MADLSFNIACKEQEIAQIAQLYQFFQLSHLVRIYGYGLYELRRMQMRKNVNNDVSKDSPIAWVSDFIILLYHFRCIDDKEFSGDPVMGPSDSLLPLNEIQKCD